MRIVIIGAGPAGMLAALEASKNPEGKVILVEKGEQTGRKLRITGGGRGNLTNRFVNPLGYMAKNFSFLEKFFSAYGYQELATYLDKLGVLTYSTDDGWVYPLSNSAANVTNILEARLIESNVEIQYNSEVDHIEIEKNKFILSFSRKQPKIVCDRLVIASGGKAYPNFGSDGKLFEVIRRLGHTILPVHPALAPVLLDMKVIHGLQGLRMDAGIEIFKKGDKLGETYGNIIFTNWGMNGPGVMDLSHLISQYGPVEMYMEINLISEIEEHVKALFDKNQHSKIPVGVVMGAFLHPKLVQFLSVSERIKPEIPMSSLSKDDQRMLLNYLECLRVDIKGVKGFDQCQASTGGVSLDEVDPVTMQSRLVPGLYFAGEVLDVVGPCGGYNLHWAFSSGICAGASTQFS